LWKDFDPCDAYQRLSAMPRGVQIFGAPVKDSAAVVPARGAQKNAMLLIDRGMGEPVHVPTGAGSSTVQTRVGYAFVARNFNCFVALRVLPGPALRVDVMDRAFRLVQSKDDVCTLHDAKFFALSCAPPSVKLTTARGFSWHAYFLSN